MDIDGFGEKLVNQLVDKELLENVSDIFYLEHKKISELDKMGNKSATNILEEIEKSKLTTFSRFINSLGIRYVGQTHCC